MWSNLPHVRWPSQITLAVIAAHVFLVWTVAIAFLIKWLDSIIFVLQECQ